MTQLYVALVVMLTYHTRLLDTDVPWEELDEDGNECEENSQASYNRSAMVYVGLI